MKPWLTALLSRARNPRDKDFRNHLYIFLICVGISLFIWFLIKMSDEYVADINVPIDYQNIPQDMQLNYADGHITARLRANGGDLFSVKVFSSSKAIMVNFKAVDLKKSRYFDKYYILSSQLRNQISKRFDFDHSILSLYPDTLFLDFEEIITKTIPVLSMLEISCKPQYQIYDSLRLIPSEIMISGPSSIIDTLSYIFTEARSFTNLDRSTETAVSLVLPFTDDKISYSETVVKALIDIEEFTESTIELPIHGFSDDSDIRIRTFPENVHITYQVALKDYKLVQADMFFMSAFYDPEKDKEKNFLKIETDKSPAFIRITRISPEKVEFILQK
ncbi:MAG: hypothetical protein HQ565_01825 [Bacteroidetes bacterium]|nr:hypothetical protein [Bacteroidota bacterium]